MKSLIIVALLASLGSAALADLPDRPPRQHPNARSLNDINSAPQVPTTVPAMSGWNIDLVDAVETGYPQSVEIVGNLAYVGYAGLLVVLDITDLAAPKKVGFTLLAATCTRIVRYGDYLYCLVQDYPNNYLQIIDITSPTEPVVTPSLQGGSPLPVQGEVFDVDAGHLYIEHGNGVRVYDISDPEDLQLRGFCASYGITDIAARDGYVYVTRFIGPVKGLQVIDATDPANPITASTLSVSDGPYAIGPSDIALSGNYVYAVSFFENVLFIIDVSNPNAPAIVSSVPGSFIDAAVQGDYVYLSDYEGYLRVLYVLDPANPVGLPPLATPCGSYSSDMVEVSGNIAALGVDNYQVCFVDVSKPGALDDRGSYASLPPPHSLDIAGDQVALSLDYGSLAMVNRYDTSIRTIAGGHSPYIDGSYVVARGNYAYMAMSDSWYGEDDGLEIFDISDPKNTASIGHLDTPWFPGPVSLGANVVYLATYEGLWVVDVSNPALPTKVGELSLPAGDLFAQEPYLFATAEGGLKVLDVSNATSPAVVASLPLGGSPYGLWVSDSRAYIAAGTALWMVDVSDPLRPSLTGSYAMTSANNVCVRDRYAYVSAGDHLRIVDVSDPTNPGEIGNIGTSRLWVRVAVAPPYIYAVTDGPLLVFETPLMTNATGAPPNSFALQQNYPNPFNPSTTITFEIPSNTNIRIDIFDVRGRLMRTLVDELMPAGTHSIGWDGRDATGNSVGSGMYFYRLNAYGRAEAKKMVLLK